ncbi:MAG TPA: DUF3467 domain-containing protein [Methanospirillum sp.]|uniref:DUF3467 domain-containing protein n=1 Tax=Methanospirillum sp. TaxID=45200 RepID=UPI002BA6BAB6|nr:DUF3467 domain-containing protein [Methanospirillum sp.]HOJ97211.1 DUF3467 domain-containing protein [Methanospirillum sp.]HOL41924.1 DUF3467 domain-containing protein [Methanospirillum sp.]HPP78239.1 DUF3467 domain-containing protein [Methanospirillum sp.]
MKKIEKNNPETIDLHALYAYKPEDLNLDITHSSYSNMAYVQVSHRDVSIDFLEMPGLRKDGKNVVKGARIYMSHAAAQKLAESLSKLLDKVHSDGEMETYTPVSDNTRSNRPAAKNQK